jgi:hypothetical protein
LQRIVATLYFRRRPNIFVGDREHAFSPVCFILRVFVAHLNFRSERKVQRISKKIQLCTHLMFAGNLQLMKSHFLKPLMIATASVVFFASCDNSSDEVSRKNSPAIADEAKTSADFSESAARVILQTAVSPEENSAEDRAVFRNELGLLTDGFTTSYDETEGLIIHGEGTGIWLQLYSGSPALEEGVYTFTGSQDSRKPFEFWYGAVDAQHQNYLFTEGQLTVTRNGATFNILLEGKVATVGSTESKTIRSSYSGKIDRFEAK